MAIVTENQNQK
jgi:serine/threonine protein kinase